MFSQWLHSLISARERKQPRQQPRWFVPRVEGLEGRDVPSVTVIASGLSAPSGSTIGPGGDLFVAENGTGRISRVDPSTGQVTTFASGLPISPFIGFGVGAVDVAFQGSTAYVLVTLVAEDVGGTDVVGIYRVDGPTDFTVIADIGTWSIENPPVPDIFIPTGSQYAIESFRGGFLVTDGHHNRVLEVSLDGDITEMIAFDNIVPTGLEVRGNTVYVAQAGPIPHLPETGKVVSFNANAPTASTVASGARLLVDVEFGRGNSLYALSQGFWDGVFEGDPAQPDTGALVRVNENGTFTVIEGAVDRPASMEIIGDTAYIVTLDGEIWKIDDIVGPNAPAGSASAQVVAQVQGGGRALLTDPDGQVFPLTFGLAAALHADGSASGVVNFNFGSAFSQVWGAVPGVDRIHLHGKVTSFTVAEDGSVTLQGLLTEKDYAHGGGVVFVEENVPFTIVVSPGSIRFSFQWCELPTFYIEMSDGHLWVR